MKILLDQEEKLYYHIWDQGRQKYERKLLLGVGNGWTAAGMTRVLISLPDSMKEEKTRIKGYISELINACLKFQRQD